jgi:hypothetical protein
MKKNLLHQSAVQKLSTFNIELIARQNIEPTRWDQCVANAPNESPLAYSWVLDHLSPQWNGLIFNDYEGVMPLPSTHHIGLNIIQMPYEVLTLGIFTKSDNLRLLFPYIFDHPLMANYRFISYNGSPSSSKITASAGITIKQTYRLDLNKPYTELVSQFSESHRRNIRKFYKTNLEILNNQHPEAFTKLTTEVAQTRPELYITPAYQKGFDAMVKEALFRKMGCEYSVEFDHQIIATAFFLKGTKKCIPFHLANTKGHSMKASFALIDHFIRTHAEEDIYIDFAGSIIPNVAEFNRRFGAFPQNYPSVTINRLPLLLRLAKKMRLKHRAQRFLSKKTTPYNRK